MEGQNGNASHPDELHPPFPNPSAHLEFYKLFKRGSNEYDNDFIKKYDDEANTTLIFAGLFSAVASAFIIDVQSQLQPDYVQMSHALLTIIASVSLGKVPTGLDAAFPQWNGPDPTVVHVQTILYTSLSASLLAAFIAMLGKQWLLRFAQLEIHGSVADRSRDRVRKFKGMVSWRFDFIMESLPLMLQVALLLLGYALSNYFLFLNKAIAGVVIGFTAFGFLFYLLVISAATLSYACPFQTPPSLIIRFMIRFDDGHRKYLERCRKWFGRLFSWKRKPQRPRPGGLRQMGGFGTFGGNSADDHIEFVVAGPSGQQLRLDEEADGNSYALDSECVVRMFEISTDTDVLQANMKFIPEIFWHAGVRATPLERVYDAMLECFDYSTGRLAVIPKLKNQAYLSAKALLHLVVQRQRFGDESDQTVLESISTRHQMMGSARYENDSDLESILSVIDRVFDKFEPIHWKNFSPTHTHLAWMAHTLLFRAWNSLKRGDPLPDDIREFVGYTLQLEPHPPAPVIADCLLMIDLAFGADAENFDLLAIDKTQLFRGVLQQTDDANKTRYFQDARWKSDNIDENLERHLLGVCEQFVEVFLDVGSTVTEIDLALEAIAIVTSIRKDYIIEKGRHLFHVVMNAPVSFAYTQEKKWQAARCVMHGLHRWGDTYWWWVGDPQNVLTFLEHHFELATKGGENHDEPIQNALDTLGYTTDPTTLEALESFDPTKPAFVHGIRYVFQEDKSFWMRNAALDLLSTISDKWFNTPHPIMEPEQMRSLCVDWASAIDGVEQSQDVQETTLVVLFGMINSPHWRPHIVAEKWKLLEWFPSVPEDSQTLKKCLDNLELTDAIEKDGGPAAFVAWLKILWLKYGELIPEVQERLGIATKEVAEGGRADLDTYLSVVDSELKKTEDALAQQDMSSADSTADVLQTKVGNLRQARVALLALRGD